MSRPLVSLTVICYQAGRFVREAVEGALAQTYSPLEIIFSDDASPDGTFEIIQDAVKDYQGPHRIVLNRNEQNMGIGAHVSKVWLDIAQGDWIIVSAGDDVSLPHRVARLMEIATPDTGALHHGVLAIDEDSRPIAASETAFTGAVTRDPDSVEEIIRKGRCLKGATMCLNRSMLLKYGKMNADVVNEDNILAYRARHYGDIVYVDEGLMKYRLHPQAMGGKFQGKSISQYRTRVITVAKWSLSISRQIICDSKMIPMTAEILKEVRKKERAAEMDLFLFDGSKFQPYFLIDTKFYVKLSKWLLFRPYAYLKKR